MLIEVAAITGGSAGGVASGESPRDMIALYFESRGHQCRVLVYSSSLLIIIIDY